MNLPKDYYRAAKLFIDKHGKNAESMALARMNEFMAKEDLAAASAWLMISQCIQNLENSNPITVH